MANPFRFCGEQLGTGVPRSKLDDRRRLAVDSPTMNAPLPHATKLSVELEAQLRNAALYVRLTTLQRRNAVSFRDTQSLRVCALHQRLADENAGCGNFQLPVLPAPWFHVPACLNKKKPGVEYGYDCSLSKTSCAGLFGTAGLPTRRQFGQDL